jgi:4'-phosphopantetheinyl transferase EntD
MNSHSVPSSSAGTELLARLVERLPNGLTLLYGTAADRIASLYPEEHAGIVRAVQSRRSEYSTGRWLARQGLAALGVPAQAIPSGSAREPIWPAGIVGSLTHSSSVCAVVLGLAADYRGVGLDLELAEPPQTELADIILSSTEAREHCSPQALRLVFSAKESVYKCIYPICRTFLDFRDVDVRIDHAHSTFSAESGHDKASSIELGRGLFEIGERGVATLFTMPAQAFA